MSRHLASVAAHRFGLGEADLQAIAGDPQAWLKQQIGRGEVISSLGLMDTREALALFPKFLRRQKRQADEQPTSGNAVEDEFRKQFRRAIVGEISARWSVAATTRRPFAERLSMFWSNHFTVSAAKPRVAGLVGPFEREAIRPHLAGRFADLLSAAVRHPAMLIYLDNAQSIGPDSPAGRRQQRGLNENLAREILELHTLGVDGGYRQQDVIEFAKVLTGWTVRPTGDGREEFIARLHQPGGKTILGRRYGDAGADELSAVLRDLAAHPATARHLATRLARHFVADDPPPALVDRLARRYRDSDGDLEQVYKTLIQAPEAWSSAFPKLKRPEELIVSAARILRLPVHTIAASASAVRDMGQAVGAAPSPAGWADRSDEWLGPDAMWKRIEWAEQTAAHAGSGIDARALADSAFGPRLSPSSRQQIERAESGRQALALLLVAPEFQRR